MQEVEEEANCILGLSGSRIHLTEIRMNTTHRSSSLHSLKSNLTCWWCFRQVHSISIFILCLMCSFSIEHSVLALACMLAILRWFSYLAMAISEIESAINLRLLPQTSGVWEMRVTMSEESSLVSEFSTAGEHSALVSELGAWDIWGEEPSGSSSAPLICQHGDCCPKLS